MHEHEHSHPALRAASHTLVGALALTLGFAVVEALAGWWSGSLALLGDAGHMVTDTTALGLAAFASSLARRPPTTKHSYGLGRAEVVAAFINGLFMLGVVAGIVVAAVDRLLTPRPVAGGAVMGVAALGLIINILVAFRLSRGEKTLNTRAALLHVIGDLLGSVAALFAGLVIYFTGWTPIDPILSLFICALILYSSVRLLRDVLHVIMEGVPLHLDLPEVGRAMAGVDGVTSVHDLHIWTLSSGLVALSAHVVIHDMTVWETILGALRHELHERYGIEHVTLQPEPTTHFIRPVTIEQRSAPR
ncbi:MAG: cation transporter [Gammaproteobacteria bacterium]|nr:cation transporter [Gammaproteobacteria bacterium]